MTITKHIPNRLFGNLDDFFTQALRSFGPNPVTRAPGAYRYENDDTYRLRLEVPGFSKEEVTLSLLEGELTVKAESQTSDSSYERTLSLSEEVDQEAISAKLEHGILELTFPKVVKEEPAARTIEIN